MSRHRVSKIADVLGAQDRVNSDNHTDPTVVCTETLTWTLELSDFGNELGACNGVR